MDVTCRPSPNFDERGAPVSILVLHYTGMQSADAALDRLCDPEAKVSSHYLVDEDGTVWRLVPETRRAFHGIAEARPRGLYAPGDSAAVRLAPADADLGTDTCCGCPRETAHLASAAITSEVPPQPWERNGSCMLRTESWRPTGA